MRLNSILTTTLALFIFACHCKKKTNSEISQNKTLETGYLTVSFISFGDGIDYLAYTKMFAFIDSLNKNTKDTLEYSIYPWGREGERDICFKIKNTSTFNKFNPFVDSLLNTNPKTQISKQDSCQHF